MSSKPIPWAGERIGVVCGPGEIPESNAGVVLTQIPSVWGAYALVLMDSGECAVCHGMNDGPGIGWHYVTTQGPKGNARERQADGFHVPRPSAQVQSARPAGPAS